MASAHHSEPNLPLPWHLPRSLHNQDLFAAALQDLRNLRPHLHSAAEYYEVAYLHSNQKRTKAVVQSLREYCANALVNAVDHLGTVASHLDESLSLVAAEICNVGLRTAPITTALRSIHEQTTLDGRMHFQQLRSRNPAYHKHFQSIDLFPGKQLPSLLQLSPGKLEEIYQANIGSDSSTLKSLSWYLAFESTYSSAAPKCLKDVKRNNHQNRACIVRSLSSGQTPRCNQVSNPSKDNFPNSSSSLRSLMILDADHEEDTLSCKNPFVSIFGTTKGVKSRSIDLSRR